MNGVQIEWVLESGVPYFVDFSCEHGDLGYSTQAGMLVIAEGVARGPLFRLDDDDLLYRLSVEVAVVGDDVTTDLLGARQIGATAVLVRTGKFSPAALAMQSLQPDLLLDSIANLPALFAER